MKKILLLLCLLIIAGSLSGCGSKDEKKSENKNNQTVNNDVVQLEGTLIYLVDLSNIDTNNQADLPMHYCGNSLVGVRLNEKLTPREALERLFNYKDEQQDDKFFNPFSLAKNLKIKDLVIKNDFAILTLTEGLSLEEEYICSGNQLHDQIEKTLVQFDNIAGVDVFVGDQELSSYLMSIKKEGFK